MKIKSLRGYVQVQVKSSSVPLGIVLVLLLLMWCQLACRAIIVRALEIELIARLNEVIT